MRPLIGRTGGAGPGALSRGMRWLALPCLLAILTPCGAKADPAGEVATRACAALSARVVAIAGEAPVFLNSYEAGSGEGPNSVWKTMRSKLVTRRSMLSPPRAGVVASAAASRSARKPRDPTLSEMRLTIPNAPGPPTRANNASGSVRRQGEKRVKRGSARLRAPRSAWVRRPRTPALMRFRARPDWPAARRRESASVYNGRCRRSSENPRSAFPSASARKVRRTS